MQGLTGREGRFHAEQMMAYGTRIVAGVTPGKGGQNVLGVPVFNSCAEAVAETGADTSVIFVPAMAAADSACEAAAAGIKLVILITEHIPVLDMVRVRAFFLERGTKLIGPNCPGIIRIFRSSRGSGPDRHTRAFCSGSDRHTSAFCSGSDRHTRAFCSGSDRHTSAFCSGQFKRSSIEFDNRTPV